VQAKESNTGYAQVSREDIDDAVSRIDVSLDDLISFIIDHQKLIY
jgi:hypothetical protein